MKFVSTRGSAPAADLSSAINAGLAADGGLFVPDALPGFDPNAFDGVDTLAGIAARHARRAETGIERAWRSYADALKLGVPAPIKTMLGRALAADGPRNHELFPA